MKIPTKTLSSTFLAFLFMLPGLKCRNALAAQPNIIDWENSDPVKNLETKNQQNAPETKDPAKPNDDAITFDDFQKIIPANSAWFDSLKTDCANADPSTEQSMWVYQLTFLDGDKLQLLPISLKKLSDNKFNFYFLMANAMGLYRGIRMRLLEIPPSGNIYWYLPKNNKQFALDRNTAVKQYERLPLAASLRDVGTPDMPDGCWIKRLMESPLPQGQQ